MANEADLARRMVAKLFLCRFAPVHGFVSVHVFGWLEDIDGRSSRRCYSGLAWPTRRHYRIVQHTSNGRTPSNVLNGSIEYN